MGQIIGGAAKPKRCNLNQLSQLGTPAAGEYILVSSDNSMNAAGQGDFDCYIVGDGNTAATALPLKNINELKEKVDAQLGYKEEYTPQTTFTEGYSINGGTGAVFASSYYSVSDKIYLDGATYYSYWQRTSSPPYCTICAYKDDDTFIGKLTETGENSRNQFPENTAYIRYTAMTARLNGVHLEFIKDAKGAVYEYIDQEVERIQEEIDNIPINEDLPKRYLVDGTTPKPLLAEMMADFAWCSMTMPAVLSGKNVVLIISGNQGSSEITASSITPDGLAISDIGTGWVGGVISADGTNYSVCNFRYKDGSTIEIFPALQENITNGTLSTLMFDSGTTYSGMHLTENGYKAYMQNLYGKNPRHCEVGKYIARFRADIDETCPFAWYGGTIAGEQYRFTTENMYNYWLNRPSTRAYCYSFYSSYASHTTKSGAYWEVDLKGKSGYLEAFIFPIANGILNLPQEQEIHVEVTIDGNIVYNSVLTTTICKRICVDYNEASTGKIEIYSNKWSAVDGLTYGFGLGRVTWWVNELGYPDNVLFPQGAVIAEEFDSWGVFHDEASAKELERLHNEMTGVTVPFTNHSSGGQTSAWGMAWFYENVWKYNPTICIHDFLINDRNSIPSSLPETVEGPDGKLYNNRLTQEQYCANMITLGKLATYNGIQPIFMRNCQHGPSAYYVFSNALVDALSEEVE